MVGVSLATGEDPGTRPCSCRTLSSHSGPRHVHAEDNAKVESCWNPNCVLDQGSSLAHWPLTSGCGKQLRLLALHLTGELQPRERGRGTSKRVPGRHLKETHILTAQYLPLVRVESTCHRQAPHLIKSSSAGGYGLRQTLHRRAPGAQRSPAWGKKSRTGSFPKPLSYGCLQKPGLSKGFPSEAPRDAAAVNKHRALEISITASSVGVPHGEADLCTRPTGKGVVLCSHGAAPVSFRREHFSSYKCVYYCCGCCGCGC